MSRCDPSVPRVEELRESAVDKAVRLVREGSVKLGWADAGLAERRKGDEAKLALAFKLRAQMTMTLAWIATRLRRGTGTSPSKTLSAQRLRER